VSRNVDADLIVRVVQDVARTLGEAVAVPVLRDARLDDPSVADEVAIAASYHGVLPLLWSAIERDGASPAMRTAVRDAYLPLVARALRLQHLLEIVDFELTRAGIRYAVYKGPATARRYPSPELRAFGDIELLVDRGDLEAVDDALHGAGFSGGWTGTPDAYAETGYHLPGAGALDLHWHVMREPAVRTAFELETAAMLARATRHSHTGGTALMLDTVDELIAVATHACFDGAYRLGWFVDVARLLGSPELDEHELRRRCAETRTALPVQVILDRTSHALGLPARTPLVAGPWRALLRGVSAARPVERSFRQVGRGGLVFRATRPTSGRSVTALGSIVIDEGLRPLMSDPNHRWRIGRKRRI
jgi:hypothetical protein